ncbi:MAG TPA: DUF3089 domain-containing protein [Croceibacterium sp.]|nr:DUF3089 domain-containing protein [Croceibacterium sp.]
MRLFPGALSRAALVPTAAFEDQPTLAENAYDDPAMWFSMPGKSANDPSRWVPPGVEQAEEGTLPAAVFFVHPTSYLDRARWNAPLKDEQSQLRAQLFLRGIASPFGMAKEIWAPRYRQATFGAFLTDKPEGQQALDAAYADVEMAFDRFVASIGPDVPIVLAGHSQGALHILRLLKEKIAGTPLQARIAMAYPIGWPISREHDLPALALPACESPEQTGCIVAWASYTDEADANDWLETYRSSAGFDGQVRGDSAIVCVNPLTGTAGGEAPAEANLGTLRPSSDLTTGEIIPAAVPARCDDRGLLRIGDGPDLGPYVLPGGNYHVYDVPLFWANLRQDFARRIGAWATAH